MMKHEEWGSKDVWISINRWWRKKESKRYFDQKITGIYIWRNKMKKKFYTKNCRHTHTQTVQIGETTIYTFIWFCAVFLLSHANFVRLLQWPHNCVHKWKKIMNFRLLFFKSRGTVKNPALMNLIRRCLYKSSSSSKDLLLIYLAFSYAMKQIDSEKSQLCTLNYWVPLNPFLIARLLYRTFHQTTEWWWRRVVL